MQATFTPLESRSTAAILALYVKVGCCALAIGADVRRIVIAGDLEQGSVLVDELLGADQLVLLAASLELIALLVVTVLFLRWQVAAHRNLPALGDPTPRIGVAAGVAAWFVPVLNLLRPMQVVAGLWRAGEGGTATPALVRAWWAAWLVAVAAVAAAWVLPGAAADVADRQRIDALRAGATALSAVAAGLAIAVVSQTTRRQEGRARAVAAPRAGGPPPGGDVSSEGGLRVVSEAEARSGRSDA